MWLFQWYCWVALVRAMLGTPVNVLQISGHESNTHLCLSCMHLQWHLGGSALGLYSPTRTAFSGNTPIFDMNLPCVASTQGEETVESHMDGFMARPRSWYITIILIPLARAQDLAPTKLQGKLRYRFLHGQEEGNGAGAPCQHACTPWSAWHYRKLTVDFMKANTQIIQRLCYGFMVSLLPGTGFCFAKTKAKCGLSVHVYVCVRK